jgi:hypothetical protein
MTTTHRSHLVLILTFGLAACDPAVSTTDTGVPGPDTRASSCSCTATYNGREDTFACGTGSCFQDGSSDRWAFCTATGDLRWGNRNCVQDAWDDLGDTAFDCDGVATCPAGTYCAIRVGPEPRRTECRPLPTGCTPPRTERDYCDCLYADAATGVVCTGTRGTSVCEVYLPRTPSIACYE